MKHTIILLLATLIISCSKNTDIEVYNPAPQKEQPVWVLLVCQEFHYIESSGTKGFDTHSFYTNDDGYYFESSTPEYLLKAYSDSVSFFANGKNYNSQGNFKLNIQKEEGNKITGDFRGRVYTQGDVNGHYLQGTFTEINKK